MALAVGVATLGSLYLTLPSPLTRLGPADAAAAILAVLALNALGVSVMSRGLPTPRT